MTTIKCCRADVDGAAGLLPRGWPRRWIVSAVAPRISERDSTVDENNRLYAIIRELQRARFGRRSEKLSDDQLSLRLEELEQQVAEGERIVAAAGGRQGPPRRVSRKINRGALPESLLRRRAACDG